jgi:hypothetical protein
MLLGSNGEVPEILPFVKHDPDSGMIVPPYSIMFAVLRGAKASLCLDDDDNLIGAADKNKIVVPPKFHSEVSGSDVGGGIEPPKLHVRAAPKFFEGAQAVTSITASSANGAIIIEYCFVAAAIFLIFVGMLLVVRSKIIFRRGRQGRQKGRMRQLKYRT